jgi:hypothetical protein
MPLKSRAFKDNPRLEACLVQDSAHLTPGVQGDFVAKVQAALFYLDGLRIAEEELASRKYGPSTAAAVLAYKTKRQIINRAYQRQPDNIVGKMTIKSLDDELSLAENSPDLQPRSPLCMERFTHSQS